MIVEELLLRTQYKILIEYDENLDYYTQCRIILDNGKKRYVLATDNILYFKNLFSQYINNEKKYQLDKRINEEDLSILYIKYIRYIMCDKEDKDLIIENGKWIGEKYICLTTDKYTTWFFYKQNYINIKVTQSTKLVRTKMIRGNIESFSFSKNQYLSLVDKIQKLATGI